MLDETGKHLFLACVLRRVFRFKLLCVDPVLPRPAGGLLERIKARGRRRLLASVDRFVLYFRDTAGYQQYYGIRPERTVYLPFKANVPPSRGADGDGGYILCAGRSRRDIDTFVRAMRKTGLPAIIVQQAGRASTAHGTPIWTNELPVNVRLVIDEGEALWELLLNARLVVIPRYKDDINATGISLCLSAMAWGKCVIISRGPGADDVMTDGQAKFVEPENPEQLAEAAERVYYDADLRRSLAGRGRAYAESLGDGHRLARDLMQEGLAMLAPALRPSSLASAVAPVRKVFRSYRRQDRHGGKL